MTKQFPFKLWKNFIICWSEPALEKPSNELYVCEKGSRSVKHLSIILSSASKIKSTFIKYRKLHDWRWKFCLHVRFLKRNAILKIKHEAKLFFVHPILSWYRAACVQSVNATWLTFIDIRCATYFQFLQNRTRRRSYFKSEYLKHLINMIWDVLVSWHISK